MNNPDIEASSSENIVDLANLPDAQRQLMNWIIRQKKVTFFEIVNNHNISEQEAQNHLDNLIFQGLIQTLKESETIYYKPLFTNPKKSRLPQNIWDKLET